MNISKSNKFPLFFFHAIDDTFTPTSKIYFKKKPPINIIDDTLMRQSANLLNHHLNIAIS